MGLTGRTTGRGTRLVLAHGFTQNADCWADFADDLGADHQLVTVDLPGHGTTDPEHDTADLWTAAELLVDAGGPAIYVGYSMGGRIALHAALRRPEEVRGLVLIGATAGIDAPAERAERRAADEALAARLTAIGLEAFLDRWLAAPLFAGLSPLAQCRPARLRNRPEGLAASLRHCGTGTQEPLWGRLSAVTVPVLVVAGDDDPKFLAIGERLTTTLPNAVMRTAPSTHAVHLARPTTTAELVRRFAAEHGLD